MSAPAFASEKEFQDAVRTLARATGWLTFHPFSSKRTEPGFPDLTMVHAVTGRLIFAELKAPRGRVSAEQWAWLNALSKGGAEAHLWRPSDWSEIHNILVMERKAAA